MTQPVPSRRRRWPRVLGILVLVTILVGAGLLFLAYRNLEGNIATIDPGEGLGDVRPAKESQALNILAIGSDTREGDNSSVGGDSPGLADTTMLLHLSADDTWAAGVSIPRDSMVEMPDCIGPDGAVVRGELRQFNAAYVIGGPVCVQRTMESLTGIAIDHFVVLDFVGFVDMVDAVGGVTVYIDAPISDPSSDIYFETGCQALDGQQALDYVRVRKGVEGGNGSDTQRIERQQEFLAALIRKVTSTGTLVNPVGLYQFLDAATSSVTTNTGLGTIRALASVAVRAREVGLSEIEFLTVPVEDWPPNPNRVQWVQPDADELWTMLRLDQPSRTPSPSPGGDDSAAPTDSAGPGTSTPSDPGSAPGVSPGDAPTCPVD